VSPTVSEGVLHTDHTPRPHLKLLKFLYQVHFNCGRCRKLAGFGGVGFLADGTMVFYDYFLVRPNGHGRDLRKLAHRLRIIRLGGYFGRLGEAFGNTLSATR
jgi:hypothetical protein